MKHIFLYESFISGNPKDLIFEWMPKSYTDKLPGIPEKLTINELQEFSKNVPDSIDNHGLFIAHLPEGDGFIRLIVINYSPLRFNLTRWDSNYTILSEYDDIDPSQINISNLMKGDSVLRRFGIE